MHRLTKQSHRPLGVYEADDSCDIGIAIKSKIDHSKSAVLVSL